LSLTGQYRGQHTGPSFISYHLLHKLNWREEK
jgi:hypothetical protein